MPEYDNTNTGALFRNDDKQTEKHPDYKGSINVGGVEYWLNSWVKTSKAGKKYMSLAVQPKVPVKAAAKSAPPQEDEFTDDIPFSQEVE